MLLLAIPHAVELSTCIGIAGCGWPISSSVVRNIVASFMLVNRPAVSALAAEDTTTQMTPVGVKMAPLGLSLSLFPMKK